MLNGVSIFNDGDASNGDAYINEGKTMDSCNGHVAINTYHTHTLPGGCCAYTESGKTHSPFWAVMVDGKQENSFSCTVIAANFTTLNLWMLILQLNPTAIVILFRYPGCGSSWRQRCHSFKLG